MWVDGGVYAISALRWTCCGVTLSPICPEVLQVPEADDSLGWSWSPWMWWGWSSRP